MRGVTGLAWYFAASLLLTFAFAANLWRPRRRIGAALAAAVAFAAFVYGFSVYPGWLPPAAFTAAAVVAVPASLFVQPARRAAASAAALALGTAIALFALFGPADGLF